MGNVMGLFTKEIGPVFLKSNNQTEEYINKLKETLEKCPTDLKEEIEKQIALAEYGRKGEESIAFELKNSGMDMYVLQDICLEHGELSAQIDYMIVTRKRVYIIECKNMIGNIEVNSSGDFIRTYQLRERRIKEGIYSPITQNARHLQIVKDVRKNSKGNILAKKLFESHFEDAYKSIVVLANPKTLLNARYAKKEVKEQIVRVDQLIHKIKEMDQLVKDSMSEKEMLEIANFFLEKNQPNRSDYTEKNKKVIEKLEQSREKETIQENVEKSEMKSDIIESDSTEKVDVKEQLIAELKAFRLERSRQEKVKPYFIFNDAQMTDLIEKNPKDKEGLCQVSGFGPVKAEKYGEEILRILKKGN